MMETIDPTDDRRLAEPLAIGDNQFAFVVQGPERLDRLLTLIAAAKNELLLYYYSFADDASGRSVLDALIDARNRGVAVTLMIDSFGSATTPRAMFDPLIEAGARFGIFGTRASTRYLIRNHQKMAIADGVRALIGGFNIEDSYFAVDGDETGWCDVGLLVTGPTVAVLCRWYADLAGWVMDGPQTFRGLRALVRQWNGGDQSIRWTIGGPTRLLNGWARQVRRDMQRGDRLDLVAAYFSPGIGMLSRIRQIGARGKARLVVAAKSDNDVTIAAARHQYARLLRSGVQVQEYGVCKLHMKMVVIDDILYVGSANFDKRSLFINVEIMLRVKNRALADEARRIVDQIVEDSVIIDRDRYRTMRGPVARLRWWLSYLLVGVLDYTVTRRLNFGDEE